MKMKLPKKDPATLAREGIILQALSAFFAGYGVGLGGAKDHAAFGLPFALLGLGLYFGIGAFLRRIAATQPPATAPLKVPVNDVPEDA